MAEDLANVIITKAKELDESPNTYIKIVFNDTQPIFYDIIKTTRHVIIKKDDITYKFTNDVLLEKFWTYIFTDLVNVLSRNAPVFSYAIGWHRKKDKKLLLCTTDNKIRSYEPLANFANLVCSPHVTIE